MRVRADEHQPRPGTTPMLRALTVPINRSAPTLLRRSVSELRLIDPYRVKDGVPPY